VADKEIKVKLSYDGKEGEQAAKKSMGNIKDTTEDVAKKTGTLVNEKMGRAMSQFNEKTEKGRQVLTAFGGAVGGVAGQVTYYAGTFSYIIGRFNLMEMAVMGVTAVLGGMAYAFLQVDKRAKAAAEELRKHRKALSELNEKLLEAELLASGLTSAEVSFEMAYAEYQAVETFAEEARKKVEELKQRVKEGKDFTADELEEAIDRRSYWNRQLLESEKKAELAQAKVDAGRLAKRREQIKREAELEKKRAEALKKARKKSDPYSMSSEYMDEHVIAFKKEQERLKKEADQIIKAQVSWEQRRIRVMLALKEKEEKEKTAIAEREARLRERMVDKTIRNSISLFEEMGSLFAANEEQRKAVRIAAIIATAAYEAAMEVAAGFANIERPWVAAAHFTAAALYGAVAAGKVAAEASSGSGRGSVDERSSRQGGRGENPWGGEKKETTII